MFEENGGLNIVASNFCRKIPYDVPQATNLGLQILTSLSTIRLLIRMHIEKCCPPRRMKFNVVDDTVQEQKLNYIKSEQKEHHFI